MSINPIQDVYVFLQNQEVHRLSICLILCSYSDFLDVQWGECSQLILPNKQKPLKKQPSSIVTSVVCQPLRQAQL